MPPSGIELHEEQTQFRLEPSVLATVDRIMTGSKHHLTTDATGIPLLEAVPPVRGNRPAPAPS